MSSTEQSKADQSVELPREKSEVPAMIRSREEALVALAISQ
jgi:hypothetical protein